MAQPPRRLTTAAVAAGARTLARRDPVLARLLARQGPPPLWGRQPGFPTLVRIILEQQVSLAAARTMYLRLHSRLGGVTPLTVHRSAVAGLRALGLTRQKAAYCHGLATRILDGALDLGAVARAPDAAGQQCLLAVPGLGPWSVSIYYLMALRRPDVWPPGDLALAVALQRVHGLSRLPTAAEQARRAEGWAPWRSVAARLLWQYYLETPRSPRG
ncbi:MAG: DNA-3-methyladenine glycosylase 2 family protein [Gemmatimonadetes bacterium]|nr:DNA-3-methyladenine glycosylase 2 family protein [Gemmatimonadota bacterium]MBK7924026.1 DNA-3-methyladenine glycosylase 2 family protein [Gemmatimonadota bacterium]